MQEDKALSKTIAFNHPNIPPGGYHFIDQSGKKVIGSSYQDISNKYLEYCASNGLDLTEDVDDYFNKYYCKIAPHYCISYYATSDDLSRKIELLNSLKQIVQINLLMLLNYINHNTYPAVSYEKDDKVVQKKKDICLKCPHVIILSNITSGCVSCSNDNTKKNRALILARSSYKTTDEEEMKEVRVCGFYGVELLTAQQLHVDSLSHCALKQFNSLHEEDSPAECFIKVYKHDTTIDKRTT